MGGVTVKDVTAVHQPRSGVVGAPAKRRSAKKFFPTKWWEWVVAVMLMFVVFSSAVPLVFGWVTGGRFGAVGVVGNSMASTIPNGSTVLVVPLPAREGGYVVGWVGAPDNMADSAEGDEARSLVVKKYTGGKLVSTDDPNTYSKFECRGRVISVIPTQKVLWWRDTGVQNSIPDLPIEKKAQAIFRQVRERSGAREEATALVGRSDRIVSGLPRELSDSNLESAFMVLPERPLKINTRDRFSCLVLFFSGEMGMVRLGEGIFGLPETAGFLVVEGAASNDLEIIYSASEGYLQIKEIYLFP